ncbi:metallopeptidase TldD-related protein [Cyanobacterium sp. IPPAS B-1200]|uniref:metallopeptidase TldD-related protein n=1 Tax=Cyanobacterium sp. IPPAS B-1200 TaxID=1562720 RepID=UPI000852704F|nr:metallopeptidase TldD-related protein [Cyanobacterium sp. IPPAS B-1200]OEJ78902.1 Zn-dependent protease [Cyanobacterium sp. IPPAS B-1200]
MTTISPLQDWETSFDYLCTALIGQLANDQYLVFELTAENTHFVRFNNAKVRQTGIVVDGLVSIKMIAQGRIAYVDFPLTGDKEIDLSVAQESFDYLRAEIFELPPDPYIVLPSNQGSSYEVYEGNLLHPDEAVNHILPVVQGLDFTGLYASGSLIRANYNSLGQKHWFATESFFVDYSLINTRDKAIKGCYSGRSWDDELFRKHIEEERVLLQRLDLPIHEVLPNSYGTYLAPAAVADLLHMFSWGAIGEASIRQGGSFLSAMRDKGKSLSSMFSLQENFAGGSVPRFNNFGEISPLCLPLFQGGKLVNTLINSRTAKEYGLRENGANGGETLRSPEILAGNLKSENILSAIGTGLYISNLHYLNWSDRPSGRVTGMTRYGCFWVENGKIVATIKDLRFDDFMSQIFGDNLVDLTDFQEFIPNIGTYGNRSLGGSLLPGILLKAFTFTL